MVSELGFGCFAIGGAISGNSYGPTDDSTSIRAIHAALDEGCTFFDTADVYGYGHSEEVLGKALAQAPNGDGAVVATKVGGRFDSGRTVIDFSADYMRAAIDASLRRLGRDRVDLYQLHNPPLDTIRQGDIFDVLDELVRAGKIRRYGVSIHRLDEAMACLEVEPVTALQIPFNLLSLAKPEMSMLPLFGPATTAGKGLIARQPLAAGFLSGLHDSSSAYHESDQRSQWPPARRRVFAALAASLQHYQQPGMTLAQVALRFVLDEPAIATTIVGVKTPEQALENFHAVQLESFESIHAAATQQAAGDRSNPPPDGPVADLSHLP